MSRGRVAAAAAVGTLLLGAAVLCGVELRPAPPAAPLEVAAGGLVALDDAQANLATCVIDADQAVFYLVQAVNYIRFSADSCKLMITREDRTGCATSVTTVLASFGWVAAYTAATLNSCGTEKNVPAACAASLGGIFADLGEFAFIASSVVNSCDLNAPPPTPAPKKKHEKGGKAETPHLDMAKGFFGQLALKQKLDAEKPEAPPEDNPLRGWSISQCIVDLNLGVTYVGRIGIQTYFLTTECPHTGSNYDRKACALDIFNVISSIAWAAQFLSQAAVDCPENGSLEAGCAAVVSDFVAAVASFGPLVNGVADDCQPMVSGSGVGAGAFFQ